MKGRVLHILAYDKFCEPFIRFVNSAFNSAEHIFLCTTRPDEKTLTAHSNVKFLRSPYRSNILTNLRIFKSSVSRAEKIILHGNPILFYFLLFPSAIRKIYWVILGYELGESSNAAENVRSNSMQARIKDFVLGRVRRHITHIQGDSDLANVQQHSNASFFYSPIYPSNVVDAGRPAFNSSRTSISRNILAGNSTSDTNDHEAIFNMLEPFKEEDIIIYCPLSYGDYNNYRDAVIAKGKAMFGEKFVPVTKFMALEEYNSFIQQIDVAIFNHKRQEAMGVTLTLLGMGKVVYMNCHTTAFKSLNDRGIQVFDNELVRTEGLFAERDVSSNPGRVHQFYSMQSLRDSWEKIFNN